MSHNIKQYKIMALEVTGMARSFTFKKGSGMVTLDDPNPSDSPEMVMSYYSNFYPELTTATVHGPVNQGRQSRVRVQDHHRDQRIGSNEEGTKEKEQQEKETMCTIGRTTVKADWRGSSSARRGGMYGTA